MAADPCPASSADRGQAGADERERSGSTPKRCDLGKKFGLARSSEIVFVFQSANADLAKIPEHKALHRELLGLERDAKTGKVDHRVGGSKDLADALACVIFGPVVAKFGLGPT